LTWQGHLEYTQHVGEVTLAPARLACRLRLPSEPVCLTHTGFSRSIITVFEVNHIIRYLSIFILEFYKSSLLNKKRHSSSSKFKVTPIDK